MRIRLFCFLTFFILSSGLFSQPVPYGCRHWRTLGGEVVSPDVLRDINSSIARSDTFDIIHYDISIDITDISGKSITAASLIRFKPLVANQHFINFDFYHITPDSIVKLIVDSVLSGGVPLRFEHRENLLHIDFNDTLTQGEEAELTVYYHGIPMRDARWGGFINEQGYIYNLGIGITSIPPNFGKVWYPCFDSFVERATYTYHVKSAGGYKAHCQGDFLGEEIISGDTLVRSFHLSKPITTHISAIAASDYEDINLTHHGFYGPVAVRLSARPADTTSMRAKFANIGKAIDACEYWYGKDHWNRIGYVTTTMGALEIPENIAYPVFQLTQPATVNENLYAHELGHHWWGDWIAPYSHNDMWLKEGPAEYSSHLMTEYLSGREAFIKAVKENQYYVLTKAHTEDKGFWPLSPVPDAAIYGVHTYNKGASVMHNLRAYLGDSLFRKGLRAIQSSIPAGTFSPEQFRDSLIAKTGVNLNDFFNDQVFTPGFAVFVSDSFRTIQQNNYWETTVYIRQLLRKRESYYRNVPLEISFFGESGQFADFNIVAGDEFTDTVLQVPFMPESVVLNRNNRLNQARMEHEFMIYPNRSIPSVVPFVDMRIFKESLADTARVRIEHIWAGPDTSLKSQGIIQISSSHYWVVSGQWGAEDKLAAELKYNGASADNLDYDLFNKTESRVIIVYRRNASEAWRVYSDFSLSTGPLTNGTGSIRINKLIPGEYAFAKGDIKMSVQEISATASLQVFPNPASSFINIHANQIASGSQLDILSIDGRICQRMGIEANQTSEIRLSLEGMEAGVYLIRLSEPSGQVIRTAKFTLTQSGN